MRKTDAELTGIGGWLIFLAIAIVGMPGNFFSQSEMAEKAYASPYVQRYVADGSPDFDSRWQALGFIDTIGMKCAGAVAVILAINFFMKLASFPVFFTTFGCILSGLVATRVFLVLTIPTINPEYRSTCIITSVMSLVVLGCWITYVFRSRRVRLTFTLRLYPAPGLPYFQRL